MKIYTTGYQGKTFDEFITLLLDKGITHLADVRSSPRSNREEFNRDELKERLFSKSIMYIHIPELGGLVEGDYREVMKEDDWVSAYDKLKELASKGPTVIMCMEKDPMRCHRRYIVEELEGDGWEVIHIGKGGSWKERSLDDFMS